VQFCRFQDRLYVFALTQDWNRTMQLPRGHGKITNAPGMTRANTKAKRGVIVVGLGFVNLARWSFETALRRP
jgi:hypothetical protein